MKITLKEFDPNGRKEIYLDDDGFDVPGWITLSIDGGDEIELHITELKPAVMSFFNKYVDGLERDNIQK